MKFNVAVGKMQEAKVDSAVLFVRESSLLKDPLLKQIDSASRNAVKTLLDSGEFTGKAGEMAVILKPSGFNATRIILVGVGEAKKISTESYRRAMGVISRAKALTSSKKAAIFFDPPVDTGLVQAVVEGYLLGSFKMLEYKSSADKDDKSELAEIAVFVDSGAKIKKTEAAVRRGEIIADGQLMVRRLATMPSNELTPQIYARRIQEYARKEKIECQILDETAIRKEKMGLVEAVAKGSQEPPRFVVLKYRGAASGVKPIVLVGKGVTFDSGGISLKPAQDMHEMKGDMTGSAVVLASIITAARLKLRQNVVVLMPLVENMPSGKAQKPGDIAKSRKGLTVEIINTDAEGRLILADALDYADKFSPQAVIDIATLTGAALFVLGYAGAPVLGNRKSLMDQLRAASKSTSEAIWEMPIWDDHREAMKSSLADLVNSGGRPAGTITATAFLENFIGDWPWAHIDIAYVDVEPKGKAYTPKGATGFGLRLLVELLSNWKRP